MKVDLLFNLVLLFETSRHAIEPIMFLGSNR